MKPRTFRQAFAEQAGEELGRAAGSLPLMTLFGAIAFGPILVGEWFERRELARVAEETGGEVHQDEAELLQLRGKYREGRVSGRRTIRSRRRLRSADEGLADATKGSSV